MTDHLQLLQLEKDRINARLDSDPFLTESMRDDLYDRLSTICEKIDIIEHGEAIASAKRAAARDMIPF
jgi:hypothetical protein